MTQEQKRLDEARTANIPWRKWGPYLSERQWGTVREDYSADGNAWDYFTHDQARSRAYRWGEDGLAGISDDKQRLCFALALWNGADPILKERLFGLTNSEGNHGEDVKEYYYYLDSTPTHSYMKYLYKYPQSAFPYADLIKTNAARTRHDFEYELLDTGVFDGDRYFDIFVAYAKAAPEDLLIEITVCNRGPEPASLHVLPTLWFRNTWSWETGRHKPVLTRCVCQPGYSVIHAAHHILGECSLYCEGNVPLLFTENETNTERLFHQPNRTPYVKDGINNHVVLGQPGAVNAAGIGTKAAAHYQLRVQPGGTEVVRLRLAPRVLAGCGQHAVVEPSASVFADVMQSRRREADEFYASITPPKVNEDARNVMRQAFAGMLWSKQYYHFDLDTWLTEHGSNLHAVGGHRKVRNREWFHMVNDDIISMPDKWEYPWYAAWDLAFHTIVLAKIDLDFAKEQLALMLRELYLHPNGQIPAYEWNFGDVNPPVHAWATLNIYSVEKELRGTGDVDFLKQAFNKLLLNFTWWVNRKDRAGNNVFEGGFLGLDNIGVFDRSAPLPTGGHLEQADGTAWMALFSQTMLEISLELAEHDASYEDMALKFVEHFIFISAAMNHMGAGNDKMWDEQDGFFYDLLRFPDGTATPLKVRSLVGLLPLCATTVLPGRLREKFPRFVERVERRIDKLPEVKASLANVGRHGLAGRNILTLVNEDKLRRILARMLDENEFFGPYGIRSLSRHHVEHPYIFHSHGEEFRVDYLPAESTSGMFGGNSNWRGPIWFPINGLILRALGQFYTYYGDSFTIECPTGSGKQMNLFEVGAEIGKRLSSIFLRDANGERPVFGGTRTFQTDPHWRDYLLFYEYFHGDNGAGLGASHQTGWTGIVAQLIQAFGHVTGERLLEAGQKAAMLYQGKEAGHGQ